MTLVELLIAITIMGIAVVAVLATVRVTTVSTAVSRDHAKAYQWLQSAVGILESAPRASCETGEVAVREQYTTIIRDAMATLDQSPDALADGAEVAIWQPDQIEVLAPVKAWDGSAYWAPGESATYCHEADGFKLQLVTLQVRNPDGRIIETLQVVKHG